MKVWKRVILVSTLLVGSAATFASWALHQFDEAFALLDAPPVAAVVMERQSAIRLSAPVVASSTPQSATSSPPELQKLLYGPPLTEIMVPGNGTKVYTGCTYAIGVRASSTIQTLEAMLVDADLHAPVVASTSGLMKPHKLAAGAQQIAWKVGQVEPGVYYLAANKINGTSLGERSYAFTIYETPTGLESSERSSLCESTGGTL